MDALPFRLEPDRQRPVRCTRGWLVAALRRKRGFFGWPPRRRTTGLAIGAPALIIGAVIGASVFGFMHFRSAEAAGPSMSLNVYQNGPITCSGSGIHRKCKV